jgi:hypothetical protein
MPALPRRLFLAGADLLTGRMARRLRKTGHAAAEQASAWRVLTRNLAATAYGRAAGLERGMSLEQFRRRIPPQRHEAFAPWIERMQRGEADVLWPGLCHLYAITAGTSTGRPRHVPVTPAMLAHFRQASRDALLHYTARVGHARVFRGRHLFLGGTSPLAPLPGLEGFAARGGDLSGIGALHLPGWAEEFLHEPSLEIARMSDWTAKLDAIVERTWNRDITLVAGLPPWVLALAGQLRTRVDNGSGPLAHLRALWPNLECLVHGGTPVTPYTDQLRAALGPGVNFHEILPSSEAFIAAQDSDGAHGLRLLTDAGVYHEFLPISEYREAMLGDLGPKVVPLEGVRTGVDYALVLTTPAGLSRYLNGDIVRFVSVEPPRLVYVGQTGLRLARLGEQVSETEVTEALTEVCRQHGWPITNFHVAPQFPEAWSHRATGRHEWWVELRPGSAETPTGPILAAELDIRLSQSNPDYGARRRDGRLEPPVVRLVIPGVFEHWLRQKGKWGGQHKMPRCRSDRQIADELAALTRFTEETGAPFAPR